MEIFKNMVGNVPGGFTWGEFDGWEFSLYHFKDNRKNMGSSKNSPPFGRLAFFHVTITGNVECFQYFNFKITFLKKKLF